MKTTLAAANRIPRLWTVLLLLALATVQVHSEQSGLFTYRVDGDEVTITDYPEDATGEVVIPAEIEGAPVTRIGYYAFSGCSLLTRVTIPASITEIGWEAFAECTGLTSLSIPGSVEVLNHGAFRGCVGISEVILGEGIRSIRGFQMTDDGAGNCYPEYGAFSGCTGLTRVRIPVSVTSLGSGAFLGCSALESIEVAKGNANYVSADGILFDASRTTLLRCPERWTGSYAIPEGVTLVGGVLDAPFPSCGTGVGAFSGCTGLTSVTIPSSVTEIGGGAFSGCTGLTSVTIPEGVTEIGRSAFYGCTGLTSVTIPEGVSLIPSGAFRGCSSLRVVVIPSSVIRITGTWSYYGASFGGCDALTAVIFLGSAPVVEGDVFPSAPGVAVYYLRASEGFSTPLWEGYSAFPLDEAPTPSQTWRLEHGLGLDADLHQDLNGDGVSLLMAYALDLDPERNLRGSLPVPALAGDRLEMFFHGASLGISYRVETSVDLENWTSDGVLLSEFDPGGRRSASVTREGPQRFLRLLVEETP